jgi:4-aminobutyrate aminotransferase-like enzyme
MIIEPLQGYGGIFPLQKGYMKEAFAMVREAGGICISDEVQTGCVGVGVALRVNGGGGGGGGAW